MAVVFLSYCTTDKASALLVEEALTAAGHAVFLDIDHEDGIAPGADWRLELFSAVTACNAVVFVNSPDSQASQWCHTELALAAEHRKWVYAVNLTADVGPHPLLADKQGIRLEATLEESLERLGAALTKDLAGLNAAAHWDRSRGPFPGLRSFEAADAGVFFGRDGAVGDVIKRLEDLEMTSDGNLLVLIGPSGSGKSSLVKAGVLPRLANRGEVLTVGPFEPGIFPTDRLVAALRVAAPGVNASLDNATLQTDGLSRIVGRMLDASPGCRRALVVIDQVEYLGTADPQERDQFLRVLDGVMTAGSNVTLLLVARQDRLEDVQRFAPLGRYITAPLAVLPIDVDGLRLAVEEPASVARMVVDPNLTRKVVEDATDRGSSNAGRALPLVAETLRALYELATEDGRREMTAADYETVGGVKGSIRRFAEQAEAQLAGDAAALDALLPRFVTLEDDDHPAIGRPIALSLLDDGERRLVSRLQDVRLVTSDGESVRIVHDRLIEAWPRLARTVQTRRKDLLFRTQLERQSAEWAKGDGTEFLLGSESTKDAEELLAAGTGDATPALTKYVAASRRQLTRRRRRRTAIIGALTVLTVGASGLAVAATVASVRANDSKRDAQRATRVAEAGDLAARSTAADDPYDAALLAIEAESWTAEPVIEARLAWQRAESRIGQQPLLRAGAVSSGDSYTLAVAWNPAGTIIATGNGDGTLRLFDATTLRPISDPVTTGTGSASLVAWNPAGTIIATGGDDGTLHLFDAETLRRIGGPVSTGLGSTFAVAWNPAGTIIATANGDGPLQLFDATTLRPIGEPDTGTRSAYLLAWNPAGTVIATGNGDGTLRLLDATSLRPIGDPVAAGDGAFLEVVWNPSGTIIAVSLEDGPLRLFDAESLDPIGDPITTGDSSMFAVAWNPAGTVIATGNEEGAVRLFDAESLDPIGDPITTGVGVTWAVAWNPAGTMIATGRSDGMLRLFDATIHDAKGDPVPTGDGSTSAVAWNPAGTIVAAGNDDGTLRLLDATTHGAVGGPVTTGDSATSSVAWNPAGTIIATGNGDGTLRLVDATTLRPIGDPITTGDGNTSAVAWNPTGTTIATVNSDGRLRIFDATTLQPLADQISTGESLTSSVAWNPAGTTIATGSFDGTLRLFDATTLRPIGDPIITGEGTWVVAWNPAGTIIATGGIFGTVRLFDATTHSLVGDPIIMGDDHASTVAWNPTGTTIATGSRDGPRLFDAATQRPIGDPIDIGTSTSAVTWDPAGTSIATVNADGTLRILDSWSESEACAYLRSVMTVEDMDRLVGIDGARSNCAREDVVDLPPIPFLDVALP